jgi:predicted Abi (CAAX) family protease
VSAYDLVFKSEMKQIHHLLILRTLVSEQVLHRVHIICVPLEFQSLWVSLRPSKIDLVFLTEHAPI